MLISCFVFVCFVISFSFKFLLFSDVLFCYIFFEGIEKVWDELGKDMGAGGGARRHYHTYIIHVFKFSMIESSIYSSKN